MSELQVGAIKSFSAGQLPEIQDSNGTVQYPFAKAWVNFHGNSTSGTYSQSGTTVTVSMTAHGMSTGMKAGIDITSGTAVDGDYIVSVTDANTFTYTAGSSLTTSGNVTRNYYIRSQFNVDRIEDLGVGRYKIHFATPMGDANYAFIGMGANGGSVRDYAETHPRTVNNCSVVNSVTTSGSDIDTNSLSIVVFGV